MIWVSIVMHWLNIQYIPSNQPISVLQIDVILQHFTITYIQAVYKSLHDKGIFVCVILKVRQ